MIKRKQHTPTPAWPRESFRVIEPLVREGFGKYYYSLDPFDHTTYRDPMQTAGNERLSGREIAQLFNDFALNKERIEDRLHSAEEKIKRLETELQQMKDRAIPFVLDWSTEGE